MLPSSVILYQNSSIICTGNLNSNSFDVEIGEFFEFPINFPEVKGIKWDYDSFAKNIYGKGWIIGDDCDLKPIDFFSNTDWGLVFNVTDIYDDICIDIVNSIDYRYFFKIKGKFIFNDANNYINSILEENEEIEFLENIWVPILIKISKFKFKRIDYLSFAFCPFNKKIEKSNINDEFIFECNLPIPEGKFLIGSIQIKSFYDYFYLKVKEKDQFYYENIFFNINRTIEIENIPELNETKEIENNNTTSNNNSIEINNNKYITIDYFILGENEDNTNKIYCPDKSYFIISNSEEGIRLNQSEKYNYTFTLKGILLIRNQNNSSEAMLYNDINFNLSLTDNLAENEDNQIAIAKCIIPVGTPFYRIIIIFCSADKISEESMRTNDTDITLNWGLEKNRIHEDLYIKWPEEKKRKKHMYSYSITGYSLVQENYGCYKTNFYFYIYIQNLEFEPDIEFEIELKSPSLPKAKCKIYESSILKCYLPLLMQRLKEKTKIDLKVNSTYNSIDDDGNKVSFIVDDYDYDYEDFHLTLKNSCGHIFILGFLEKEGINSTKVGIVVLCIICFVVAVVICFICYISYKIKRRFYKGKYMKYVEEEGNSKQMANLKENKMDIISKENKIK